MKLYEVTFAIEDVKPKLVYGHNFQAGDGWIWVFDEYGDLMAMFMEPAVLSIQRVEHTEEE